MNRAILSGLYGFREPYKQSSISTFSTTTCAGILLLLGYIRHNSTVSDLKYSLRWFVYSGDGLHDVPCLRIKVLFIIQL